jgi:hypothetical protein
LEANLERTWQEALARGLVDSGDDLDAPEALPNAQGLR